MDRTSYKARPRPNGVRPGQLPRTSLNTNTDPNDKRAEAVAVAAQAIPRPVGVVVPKLDVPKPPSVAKVISMAYQISDDCPQTTDLIVSSSSKGNSTTTVGYRIEDQDHSQPSKRMLKLFSVREARGGALLATMTGSYTITVEIPHSRGIFQGDYLSQQKGGSSKKRRVFEFRLTSSATARGFSGSSAPADCELDRIWQWTRCGSKRLAEEARKSGDGDAWENIYQLKEVVRPRRDVDQDTYGACIAEMMWTTTGGRTKGVKWELHILTQSGSEREPPFEVLNMTILGAVHVNWALCTDWRSC